MVLQLLQHHVPGSKVIWDRDGAGDQTNVPCEPVRDVRYPRWICGRFGLFGRGMAKQSARSCPPVMGSAKLLQGVGGGIAGVGRTGQATRWPVWASVTCTVPMAPSAWAWSRSWMDWATPFHS